MSKQTRFKIADIIDKHIHEHMINKRKTFELSHEIADKILEMING